jgi:hypothetical protein
VVGYACKNEYTLIVPANRLPTWKVYTRSGRGGVQHNRRFLKGALMAVSSKCEIQQWITLIFWGWESKRIIFEISVLV